AGAIRISDNGTRNLLRAAAAESARRVVFFSTFHVYGPTPPSEVDEGSPVDALTPYARAHLAGEAACTDANKEAGGPFAIVLRVSNGYGCPVDVAVDRWTLAHNDFCREAVMTGKMVLRSSGVQRRDFGWVEDIAAAVDVVLHDPGSELGAGLFDVRGERV